MDSDNRPIPDSVFPFPEYRPYQRASLYEASNALYEQEGIDTVILNLPTGIGKSAINTALARQAESAFITTPQKALRTQLENDTDLRDYYSVLRARDDYNCPVGTMRQGENISCKYCPVNRSEDESCMNQGNCTYWSKKEDAMADSIAVLTFSYLIIDGHLPVQQESSEGDSTRISFADRELLVVDECHKLENQVASLHAGFKVSPYSLPADVFGQVDREIGELPDNKVTKYEDVRIDLDRAYDRAEAFVQKRGHKTAMEESQDVTDCRAFLQKYEWCREQVQDGRDWVVDREEITYDGNTRYSINVQPVDVDRFLQDHVWNRAEKRVLSTATMPFSSNPENWITRLGLDPDTTHVVQYPMPFPVENRRVYTDTVVGKMSSGGYERHVDHVVKTLRELSEKHAGEKGLIHTASYSRAEQLASQFPKNSLHHTKHNEKDLRGQIRNWQLSDRDMFFSPAATDGVDLPYDECRWQALVKVPYPQPSDPRVRFLLDERSAWDWYYEITSQDVQQAVGRGVRSMDDDCSFYVLDASFFDVLGRVSVPEWFEEAIDKVR